jgi:hypothetical protein
MAGYDEDWGRRPLESFFPTLAALGSVRARLRAKFRGWTQAVLAKLKAGLPLSEEELDAHDIITDLVMNDSVVKKTILGLGAYDDEFPINIMKFGNVYWIDALEFDGIGYFATFKAAKDCAEFNYESFITERERATRTKAGRQTARTGAKKRTARTAAKKRTRTGPRKRKKLPAPRRPSKERP